MRRWFSSLTIKLLAVVAAVVVVVVLSIFAALWHYGEHFFTQRTLEKADSIAQSIADASGAWVVKKEVPALESLLHDYALQEDILFLAIYDDREAPLAYVVNDLDVWNSYSRDIYSSGEYLVRERLVLPEGVVDQKSAPAGRVVIGYSAVHSALLRDYLAAFMAMALTFALLMSGGVVSFIARGWKVRINQLVDASWKISHGDLSCPIEADKQADEISQLAQAFEAMRKALLYREKELQKLNESLQLQVRERTFELQMETDRAEASSEEMSAHLSTAIEQMLPATGQIIRKAETVLESKDQAFDTLIESIREMRQDAKNIRTIVHSVKAISALKQK